jgi:hypothetical protein
MIMLETSIILPKNCLIFVIYSLIELHVQAHLSGNHKDVSSDEERGSTVRQLDGVAKSGALKTGVKSGEYIQRIHSEQVEKVPTDERLDGMEQVQVKIKVQ